jgi:hypothetical protein
MVILTPRELRIIAMADNHREFGRIESQVQNLSQVCAFAGEFQPIVFLRCLLEYDFPLLLKISKINIHKDQSSFFILSLQINFQGI